LEYLGGKEVINLWVGSCGGLLQKTHSEKFHSKIGNREREEMQKQVSLNIAA
jgi:hypothetical protein